MTIITMIAALLLLSFTAFRRGSDPCMGMERGARRGGAVIPFYTFLAWGAVPSEFADGLREMLRAREFYLLNESYQTRQKLEHRGQPIRPGGRAQAL